MTGKFHVAFSIALGVLCNIALCQESHCHLKIDGTIRDLENNLPVSYVNISIEEVSRIVSSDSSGRYHFDNLCPGNYTLHYQRIGFVTGTLSITLNEDQTSDIEILFDPGLFKSVDIVAYKYEERTATIESSLIGKDLAATQGVSLGEGLKKITGITSLNTGSGISKPVIHGLHSNRILILNNGVRQEGQQWGSEHAPEIDPFIAGKLTVIKGASTVRYGADAIAGVILVEPKGFPKNPGITSEVNAVGMSNGLQGMVSAVAEGTSQKISGLSGRVQGTLKRSGNVSSPRYYLKNTGSEECNYSFSAAYSEKRIGIEIFYSQFNTRIGIFSASHIGNLTDLQRALTAEVPLEQAGFSYTIDKPYQMIEHELFKTEVNFHARENGRFSLVYARQYNLRNEYDKHKALNDSIASLNLPELHLEITTHTIDLTWEQKNRVPFQSQLGVTGMKQGNTYEGRFFIPNFLNEGIGAFGISKWQKDKLQVEAGARYELRHLQIYRYKQNALLMPEHIYNNLSGSVGATYKLNENLALTANAASAWRPPQASELYSNGLHHGAAAVEIGDEDLLPEKAWCFIGSLNYQGNQNSLEVSPYFNYIRDFINLTPQLPPTLTIRGAFPTFYYKQVNASFKGIDVSFSLSIFEYLQIKTRTSILRAVNETTHEYLIQMPADKYETTLEHKWKDRKHIRETFLSATLLYTNKQWRVPADSDFASPPQAYTLLSVNVSTQLHIGKQVIELGMTISNLLNTTYRDYMNRFRYYTDDMGRNISIRIKIPMVLYLPKTNESEHQKNQP